MFSDLSVIEILNLLVLTATLVILAWQVLLLRKQIAARHEWDRRNESIKYSGFFHPKIKESRDVLNKHFNIYTRKDAISLNELQDVFKAKPNVRADLNYLLTYYENMAIACSAQTADKDILKRMTKGSYINFKKLATPYIDWRRSETGNAKLWFDFTNLAAEWERDDAIRDLDPTG